MNALSAGWHELNEKSIGTKQYWYVALQNLALYRDTAPLIAKYVRGQTLDLGAGKLAWRSLLKQYSETYISSDITREHPELDVLFDATKQFPFADHSFDTIFCHSVLEHTREPWQVFAEMYRVLTPGGALILSVPFVFYLHGQPHDYYRFSRYGVEFLAVRSGFKVVKIVPNGGLIYLLLNVPSVLFSSLLSAIGLTRLMPIGTQVWFALARLLSKQLEPNTLFAMNYLAVLTKVDSAKG